ncbi:MAG: LptF/LptG family permease [Saprospiraceae bacterium]
MMTRIDRYILNKFMSTFFFTVLLFTLITVIVDFSEKVEKFIESDITQREIYLQYYPNFIIFIYGLLFPLFTLIAVVFFTSRLANNSEVLSIFNAGVSFKRFLRPYLVGAVFIAILHAIGSNYFIPIGTKVRLELEQKYFDPNRDVGKNRNIHMFLGPDTKIYVNTWRKTDSTMRGFRLERFEKNELVYLMKATSAKWQGEPDNWRLSNYEIRTFDGLNETFFSAQGKHLDTTLAVRPEDFSDYKEQQSMMTSGELLRYVEKQKQGA